MTTDQDKPKDTNLQKSVDNAKAVLRYGNPKRATDENARDFLEGISEFSDIIDTELNKKEDGSISEK